ncbi:MAG: zinc ABC transporter substrate-binding protein [Pelotomaculum sp.]|nr:zinc ABC transporter substrate-binding protein [Pelotomaculum sp.]
MKKPRCVTAVLLMVLILGLIQAGCVSGYQKNIAATTDQGDRKLKIVTTIYPLYDFTRNIAGEKAEVLCLVAPGSEPHGWEPTPRDLAEIQKADVFIYCGAGMEEWIEKAINGIDKQRTVVVDASRNIQLITLTDEESDGAEFPDTDSSAGSVNGKRHNIDPHIWLDPVNAMQMVENICAGLAKADPASKEFYDANALGYRKKLEELDGEYKKGLANAPLREFITSHAAFGYLAKRYGLIQIPVRGLSPEVEPTPARMAEVVKIAKEKNIHYIFFETLVSPKISQIIAGEAGAQTLVLNPVGGLTQDELNRGEDYLSIMRKNLANLQKGLEVRP